MDLTVIAIILGLLAVVYGFVTSRQVLGASAGSTKRCRKSPRQSRKARKPT